MAVNPNLTLAQLDIARRIVTAAAETISIGAEPNYSHIAAQLGIYRGTVRRRVSEWQSGAFEGIDGFLSWAEVQAECSLKSKPVEPGRVLPNVSTSAQVQANAEPIPVAQAVQEDRERRSSESQLKDVQAKYGHVLSELDSAERRLDAMLAITQPVTPIKILPNLSITGGQAAAIWQASDWHVGERVDPATINHLNEYNPDIAERRARKFFQNGLKLVRKERQDVRIDTLVLWLGGDLITGYIHDELEESNYLSPVEESIFAKQLILGGLKMLKEDGEFKEIIVPTSFGNHGRTTKKRRISTGYKNSYEWMMYQDLAAFYQNDEIVKFQVVNGYLNYVECFGRTLAFHHGDDTFYRGGVGGMTIPLIKFIARSDAQRKADMHSIGHYHTRIPFSPWYRFQCNSSLIGFNAYAQSIGASPEPPTQNFQLLDAERGFTIAAPIQVEA